MKLEVVVIPVSDIARARSFYEGLGWRLDADIVAGDDFRLVQFTPPGSACSIHFGTGRAAGSAVPSATPALYLIVPDIVAARADLSARGVEVSEIFHRVDFVNHVSGPDPARRSYNSFVSFQDPDGNNWWVQEVSQRLPGRVEQDQAIFPSAADLAAALRRAAAAHGEHEKRTGENDPAWPDWYAEYLFGEQTGQEPPV